MKYESYFMFNNRTPELKEESPESILKRIGFEEFIRHLPLHNSQRALELAKDLEKFHSEGLLLLKHAEFAEQVLEAITILKEKNLLNENYLSLVLKRPEQC